MKKLLIAVALLGAFGAQAHPSNRVHYHNDDGTVTYSRSFRPVTETTYETDRFGRTVRVETTTTCTRVRINPRNNHLRCLDEETSVQRFVERDRPRAEIDPVVRRHVERDPYGRRIIVTTTHTCTDVRWHYAQNEPRCYNWETSTTRELVRRRPRDNSLDLNGDGRTEGWERLLVDSFRDVLDGNDGNN